MTAKLAYSLPEAAAATGYEVSVIRRAIRSGNLTVVHPKAGKGNTEVPVKLSKPVILAAELQRWLVDGAA